MSIRLIVMPELFITKVYKNNFREPELVKVRFIFWLIVLMVTIIPVVVFAQYSCPGIHITILKTRNTTGTVACALFNSEKGFPVEYLRSATNVMSTKIQKKQARCDFLNIPQGTYAVVIIHDENMNGKMETNWLGIPKEGYGFSNNAKGLVGAPTFTAASFPYDGKNLNLDIELQYRKSKIKKRKKRHI